MKHLLVQDNVDTLFETCTYAYNSFASPGFIGLSPFQLTYGRQPKYLLEIETNPQEGTS